MGAGTLEVVGLPESGALVLRTSGEPLNGCDEDVPFTVGPGCDGVTRTGKTLGCCAWDEDICAWTPLTDGWISCFGESDGRVDPGTVREGTAASAYPPWASVAGWVLVATGGVEYRRERDEPLLPVEGVDSAASSTTGKRETASGVLRVARVEAAIGNALEGFPEVVI